MIGLPTVVSNLLPPDVTDFLNSATQRNAKEAAVKARAAASADLLQYCTSWLKSAQAWRKQSFEDKWRIYRLHADGTYDPDLARKKKDWQSKAFYPMVPSHREAIHSSLYTLMVGTDPILEVKALPAGKQDLGDAVRDVIVRELDKSRFSVEWNSVLEDADTYGSGFARVRWEERKETRRQTKPIYEPLGLDPMAYMRRLKGQPQVLGYQAVDQEVTVYKGVRYEWLNILDVFPDPLALKIAGSPIAYRFREQFGNIRKGVEDGVYLPEALDALKDLPAAQTEPEDKQRAQIDRDIAPAQVKRPDDAKEEELYDFYVRVPQKWAYPLFADAPQITDPEKLVSVQVRFHEKTIVGVFPSTTYTGDAPIIKLDYMKVTGRFYGRGIPEMLSGSQDVVNEVVNQRLDNGNLALSKGFAVIEKALLNPKDVIEGAPGFVARLDQKVLGPNGDVRQAFFPLDLGDVKAGAGFSEVVEWERTAQERTSANRTTMGTAGQARDINRTATAQVLQREAASDKFKYIGMVMEQDALDPTFRAFYELIYQNLDPQEIVWAIGPERAQMFLAALPSPEELSRGYTMVPQGIFEMDNKAQRQARLQAIFSQFQKYPWVKTTDFFDEIVKAGGDDPAVLRMSDQEMQTQVQQMLMAQGAMGGGMPGAPGPMGAPPMPGAAPAGPMGGPVG